MKGFTATPSEGRFCRLRRSAIEPDAALMELRDGETKRIDRLELGKPLRLLFTWAGLM